MAISITRLSGGNTPADGSDPRTFPAIWNATSSALEALDLDDLTGVTITTPAENDVLVYNGSDWVNETPLLLENAEETADYTLALTDANKVVSMNKSGAGAVTVATNATVAFPIGSVVNIYNQSADDITIAGAAGVTVRNAGDMAQYAEVSLRKRATDEWVLAGVVS